MEAITHKKDVPVAPGPVVAISLDGVLRDITEPFYRAYVERFGPEAQVQTHVATAVWSSTEDAGSSEVRVEAIEIDKSALAMAPLRIGERTPEGPIDGTLVTEVRPVPELGELNPYNLTEKLLFKDEPELLDFVQGEGFFIFARAPKAEARLLTTLNQLYHGVKQKGGRLVVLASDMLKLRPATLFFLADLGASFDDIRFVSTPAECWEGVDVLVTTSQRLLAARPDGKHVAFRLTDYNQGAEDARRQPTGPNPTRQPLTDPVTHIGSLAQLLEFYPNILTDEVIEATEVTEAK